MKPSSVHLLMVLAVLSMPLMAVEPVIQIEGASGELRDNLQYAMSLSTEPCNAPAWKIKRLFKRAEQEMAKAARAVGYYQIALEKNLSFKQDCWQASFTVTPGELTHLQSVNIIFSGEADNDPDFLKLLQETPVRPGNPVHHGHYEKLKKSIETLAAERGYFDGQFTQRKLTIDPSLNQAVIKLHYASGTRYRIGKLTLEQDTYASELLDRYLNIKSGDPYDANLLATQHRALTDSGYFENVIIRQDFKGASDGKIDVNIKLLARKRTAYRVGIGAATDTGPRLTASLEKRRVNRRGHRFLSKVILSEADSSLGLEYIIPMQQPHIEQISLRGSVKQLDTDTSNSDIRTIGLRTVGKRNKWNETVYLDLVNEDSTIGDTTSSALLLVPGISWSRTIADNHMQPRKGWRMNLELRGADKALFSDTSFIQLIAGGKWITPFGKGRLLMRTQAGLSINENFSELPASYRFFAGGDQSVRGYDYQSLGPRNSDNEVIGGDHLLTASIEYELPIKDEWSAAAFVDSGNAFDDWNEGLKQSAGVGLRWRSPVGPLRLDLAVPDDRSEDDFRIHFSMGSDL